MLAPRPAVGLTLTAWSPKNQPTQTVVLQEPDELLYHRPMCLVQARDMVPIHVCSANILRHLTIFRIVGFEILAGLVCPA